MKRPFGRGTTPLRGLTNHGYYRLTNWDDPPSTPDPSPTVSEGISFFVGVKGGESGGPSSHGMLWAKSLKGRFGFMSVLCRFHQTIKDEWYQYYCIHTYIHFCARYCLLSDTQLHFFETP